jgi:hypothetical protein
MRALRDAPRFDPSVRCAHPQDEKRKSAAPAEKQAQKLRRTGTLKNLPLRTAENGCVLRCFSAEIPEVGEGVNCYTFETFARESPIFRTVHRYSLYKIKDL